MSKQPTTSGVYAIRNARTGFLYVGSSRRVEDRWATHLSVLRLGKHSNKALQQAWQTDGPDAFVFEIIEPTRDHGRHLLEAERRIVNALQKAGVPLYSIATVGRSDWDQAHDEQRRLVTQPRHVPYLPSLRRLREAAALSQEDLAALSGVARPTISELEAVPPWRSARPSTVRRLAQALKCQPTELMAPSD